MTVIRARQSLLPALAALLLAACAAASKATYPPPGDEEAGAAYLHALTADWIESPAPEPPEAASAVGPGDTSGEAGRKVVGTMAYASEMETRAITQRKVGTLRKVTVHDCDWTSVDGKKVKAHSSKRVEAEATDGYRCAYEVFHETGSRGLVSAKGTGYFYMHEGGWDFAEIDEARFAPVQG